MPRVLSRTAQNTLILNDALSGGEITLHYRMPSTEERTQYVNALVRREGGKLLNDTCKVQVDYGMKILTGFRDGDLEREPGVPLKTSDGDWRELFQDLAGDLAAVLAAVVFDNSVRPLSAAEQAARAADGSAEGNSSATSSC